MINSNHLSIYSTGGFSVNVNSATDNLIGVASIYEKSNPLFPNPHQFQLRGMAVMATHQKMGIGALLFTKCRDYCIDSGNATLWFNARTAAVPFYQSLNCQIVGTPFLIPEVGEHYIMVLD